MFRRLFRLMFRLTLVIGAAAALYRVVQARRPSPELPRATWDPAPTPTPTQPSSPPAAAAWVEPEDNTCPASHPVKAKMTSLIYHLPGMAAYERTNPDRCYRDAEAAEADGLRKAKR